MSCCDLKNSGTCLYYHRHAALQCWYKQDVNILDQLIDNKEKRVVAHEDWSCRWDCKDINLTINVLMNYRTVEHEILILR